MSHSPFLGIIEDIQSNLKLRPFMALSKNGSVLADSHHSGSFLEDLMLSSNCSVDPHETIQFSDDEDSEFLDFPLNTLPKLLNFERKLKNEAGLRSKTLKKLKMNANLNSPVKAARSTLLQFMYPCLFGRFSWNGKGRGKMSLEDLRLCKIMLKIIEDRWAVKDLFWKQKIHRTISTFLTQSKEK